MEYTIRKSRRAKRIILRVDQEGQVRVTVPWYVPMRFGQVFLGQRLSWIEKVRARRPSGVSVLPEPIKNEVARWYTLRAQTYFEGVAQTFARALNVPAPNVKISDFRSQWGSCNRRTRTVKFSWRLMVAPESVARYVAAHETAHLIEASHGKKFWKIVESLNHDFKESRRWLRRNGYQLRL